MKKSFFFMTSSVFSHFKIFLPCLKAVGTQDDPANQHIEVILD